jgi:hypothetical protein
MQDDRINLLDGSHSTIEILSWTTPDRPAYYHGVYLAHIVRQFDDAGGQVPAIWLEA